MQILAACCCRLPAANIRSMTARSRYVLFDDLQVSSCVAGGVLRKYEPPMQEVLVECYDKALQKVDPV